MVEISLDRKARTVKVHRVVCAVDVGRVVNPANIVMQSESAIVYGLSSALYGEITIANGRVVQANFNNYQFCGWTRCPSIEVYIVPSEEKPTGAGELSVPPAGSRAVQRDLHGHRKAYPPPADSRGGSGVTRITGFSLSGLEFS